MMQDLHIAVNNNNESFFVSLFNFYLINCLQVGKTRTKDKYRIVYTELQKVELEKEFLFNQYITIQRKAELAVSIGLSDRQVKIWFQNRRAKERKHKRKREEMNGSGSSAAARNAGLQRGVASMSSSSAHNSSASNALTVTKATPLLSSGVAAPPAAVGDSSSRLRQQLQMQRYHHNMHHQHGVVKMESANVHLDSSTANLVYSAN